MSDTPESAADPTGEAEDRVARARARRAAAADEDDIAPKLPRGSGFKISKGHIIKITLTAGLLVMLIVIQRPCANAVSKFVTSFDDQGSAADKQMPKPGNVDTSPKYEVIHGNMTEAEMKAAVERAKARAGGAGRAAAEGSASGSAGSGSSR